MKLKLIAFFALVTSVAFSQVKVEGIVKDSIGNPIELANVVAINQETKLMDSYSMTDNEGHYKLNLNSNSTYTLQASYIGMKTIEATLKTLKEDLYQNFNLNSDTNLDEVELVYEMPVVIKGDSLIYNADSFRAKTDRKLGDVLNKLPGVEVNDDGEIEVDGVTVRKVMVEGKDFFDGDSKLATQNIPADALDKIEVLKNYDEVSQLKSVRNNEESIAINIRLKEGKKNFWFGEITAGAGPDDRYIVHPKLFYYSPKYSINIITDYNNIGDVPFTRQDYFKFSGGVRGSNRDSGTSFNVASSDIGFLTMQNNRANSIESKFGAVNFNYAPKKTWDLSGFAIYSGNKTDMLQNSTKTYSSENNIDESTTSDTRQKADLGLFKFSSKYIPNSNHHLDYDVFGRVSKQTEIKDFYSSVLGNIDENQSQNPYSINQNLNYYYTLNPSNIFAFELQYLAQDEDPFYNAILEKTNEFKFSDELNLDETQSSYNIAQDKRIKTNKLDTKVDYWYVLNDKSNINFSIGLLNSTQRFSSEIYQILDNGDNYKLNNDDGYNTYNQITYNFSDAYLAAQYTLKTGMFTFRPGFSAHTYYTKNSQFGKIVEDSFVRLLPKFNTTMELKKTETLTFNYAINNTFTDVNKLAEGFVFNNYNSIFRGNSELENSLAHNLNLNYRSFNQFNYTNIFARLSYSKRINQIRNKAEFIDNSNNQISVPFNSNFEDETVGLNGRFEKTINKIKTSLGANYSYSKFNQLINNQQRVNESFTQSYRTQINTNFKTAPNVSVGYNLSINDYNQGSGNTKYYTHSPYVNLNTYFLKGFIFNTEYSYFNYRNNERTLNNYTFFDASLAYQKEDSKWEYKLTATNLLNTKSLNRDNINTLYTNTTEYFIQPRYIVLSLKYNL
ncbi:TonB-dependent receptor [Wenyingzhuangia fucanilytica]|uniref:TonB-dependent receptor n=1 Tax=Wenyingzhuangia fucanilytica TaxID=1790137 RepID=A0A1B1Y8K5_9FLAO|nr:TonB-dependent receptor [Wenyingzhuangia fucanilytica]ANW97111.1 TonB-dependent receptor [Wenyingzhuangia fucanilytica]